MQRFSRAFGNALPSRRALASCLLTTLAVAAGCSNSTRSTLPADALAAAREPSLTPAERVDAIARAEQDVAAGALDRLVMRHAMTEMAWSLDTPEIVRAAALESILWDEQAEADSLELVRAMLPTEPGRGAVAVMATAAADNGWTDATPALVRSFARPLPVVADTERAEYRALTALHPATPIERVALAVFLDPQTEPGPSGLQLDMRTREAAWDVMGRLARSDAARAQLLASAQGGDEEGRAILEKVRELQAAFGVVPACAEEMRWAVRIVDQRDRELAAWWQQAVTAVATLPNDARAGLALRHVEPVRWASLLQPSWLTADRQTLLAEIESRLGGRQLYARTEGIRGTARATAERLAAARDQLAWGDVLTLLVIDEALREPDIRAAVFEAAVIDNRDRTTEHGGTIWADAAGFHVQSFTPRGTATPDDRRFVAPREMIDFSAAALAHFHFHVTDWRNRDFAGPSPADLDYAARFGRTCIVFTGIQRDILNADVYLPSGVVIDLGELRRPPSGS